MSQWTTRFCTAKFACAISIMAGAVAVGASSPTAETADLRASLDVPRASQPRVSSDGRRVAYVVSRPDWDTNRYERQIYLADRGGDARPATSNRGGAWTPRWAPNSRSLAYLAADEGPPQIYVSLDGYQPRRLTNFPAGVIAFEWSPSGNQIAVAVPDAPDPEAEQRSGARFQVLRSSAPRASLWLVDVPAAETGAPTAPRRLTGSGDMAGRSVVTYSVNNPATNFSFSRDGTQIVFTHAASLNILDVAQADVAIVDVSSGQVRRFETTPTYWDDVPSFSPDGREIVVSRLNMEDFLADNEIRVIPLDGRPARVLRPRVRAGSDELGSTILLGWASTGINVLSTRGVEQHAYQINPQSGLATQISRLPSIVLDFQMLPDGSATALLAMEQGGIPEVYLHGARNSRATRLTNMASSFAEWPAHTVELATWRSPDGVSVEGVLYTPANVTRPAPLIVVAHGGPRDVARPSRLPREMFPIEHWLGQGAVILFPNYRGSIGYGEQFRRLTVRNTGFAEKTDIDSGVDALVGRGLVDPDRVAVVGHSWGGYLSAFLATTSQRYRAAVVVSGITDNTVNYVLSNASIAELGYLKSSPWRARELWLTTSPIGHAADARTPTLIIHGEQDPVVPVENARILDRALADVGAPVRTLIFAETGHSDFRPEVRLVAAEEMIRWMDQYLFQPSTPR